MLYFVRLSRSSLLFSLSISYLCCFGWSSHGWRRSPLRFVDSRGVGFVAVVQPWSEAVRLGFVTVGGGGGGGVLLWVLADVSGGWLAWGFGVLRQSFLVVFVC